MAKTTDLPAVRVVCHKAAEHLFKNWRDRWDARKDDDYCKVAIAFDGEEPGEVSLVSLAIPWTVLETCTLPSLCDILYRGVVETNEAPPTASIH